MTITNKKVLSLLFAALFSLSFFQFAAQPVQADEKLWKNVRDAGLTEIGSTAYDGVGQNPTDIRIMAARFIRLFLGFLGLIFLVIVIRAGYSYMTAEGNEEKVTEALGQIKSGVIGLLIIVAAYSITYFVTDKVYYVITKF